MKLAKILALALALVMCLGAFAACGGKTNYAQNNTEFVIGLSGLRNIPKRICTTPNASANEKNWFWKSRNGD